MLHVPDDTQIGVDIGAFPASMQGRIDDKIACFVTVRKGPHAEWSDQKVSLTAAACELRTGILYFESANSGNPDVVRAIVHCEKFTVASKCALANIEGFQPEKPNLTLAVNRTDLDQTMMGAKTLEAQLADGTAKVQGDVTSEPARIDLCRCSHRPLSTSTPALKSRLEAKGTKVAKAEDYEAKPGKAIAE
jgi:hypothetical protein